MTTQKPHYIAQVRPVDGGFLGEVVRQDTGAPAGLASRTQTAAEAATDAVGFAEDLNTHDVRYDG